MATVVQLSSTRDVVDSSCAITGRSQDAGRWRRSDSGSDGSATSGATAGIAATEGSLFSRNSRRLGNPSRSGSWSGPSSSGGTRPAIHALKASRAGEPTRSSYSPDPAASFWTRTVHGSVSSGVAGIPGTANCSTALRPSAAPAAAVATIRPFSSTSARAGLTSCDSRPGGSGVRVASRTVSPRWTGSDHVSVPEASGMPGGVPKVRESINTPPDGLTAQNSNCTPSGPT